ncbi:conserved hypothetical protein [Nitrosococcus halophilus Nc 4]|uniref:Molybdenum cofactor carrier n=2 Tax=Nitrosococcus halophilus TaxID=133539 RepID=D5BYS6_NITHN|nr:conserved hypothetical protein [Nitrosococcus halophilus Nc 4]
MTLSKIISGGQTGVDRGALDAALDNHFPCGGWCPAGRAAEDGPIPARYPLIELPEGGYRERTLKNVEDSDATAIIYFGELEGGTEQTLLHCLRRKKPYKLIDATEVMASRAATLIVEFIADHGVISLNVAGPRLSKAPQAHTYAYECVTNLLRQQTPSADAPQRPG